MDVMKIDEAKARIWIQDVEIELDAVEQIQKNVTEALMEIPEEQDDIFVGIVNTAQLLQGKWHTMCGGFKNATSHVKEAIDSIKQGVQDVVEDLSTLKGKL